MHIAICDDNIADRKQLERLLSRESDKRMHTTGNLYIDSFGSAEALLHAPMMYELFFIDYHSDKMNGMDLALKLRKAGVTATIVLCSGETDYTNYSAPATELLHIKKPILTAELSALIEKSYDITTSQIPPVAIQGESETIYVTEDDFMIAYENQHHIYIQLRDGSVRSLLGKLSDLQHTLDGNPHFYMVRKYIVNFRHVTNITLGHVTMDDGRKLSFPLHRTGFLKNCLNYASRH